ncbi:histidine kinase, partial [Streptomyces sp. ventii]|nr:histidine kinase [Streptomyces spiramenti]
GPGWAAVAAVAAPVAAVGAGWWSGCRYGARTRAARLAHEDRITEWTGEAVREAWAERSRITAGLETTVLARTAAMVREAEAGRLAETAERAREALAAMRALLDRQGTTAEYAERRPQPTLGALDLLVRQSRAAGRRVEVRADPEDLRGLPVAVDLAAYRAAESLLAAAGRGPAVLRVERGPEWLTLCAEGLRELLPERSAELAAGAEALRGTFTSASAGSARLLLPLGAGRVDDAAPGGRPVDPGHGEGGGGAPEEERGSR